MSQARMDGKDQLVHNTMRPKYNVVDLLRGAVRGTQINVDGTFCVLHFCIKTKIRLYHQIDILSGMRKLQWTKAGKESINAAKSDKDQLVSLLMKAGDQVCDF